MKKVIIISFFLISVTASFVFAQSLQYNDYYKKSVEYSKLSQEAINNGNYDLGNEHAVKSQEYAALSRQYIAEMLALFRAKNALEVARERIAFANRLNYKTRDSELYNEALTYYKSAGDKLNSKDYENSILDSNKVIDLLKDIAPPEAAAKLAATYVVKLNPAKRDCLWRIADMILYMVIR
jgi:hypothetical protein